MLEKKTHEIIENLDINTREMEATRTKIQQSIREINDILQIEDPAMMWKTAKFVEKKQEVRLKELETLAQKLREVIVHDFTFQMDIKDIAHEINKLHTKDRLSIARWKIPYMDHLHTKALSTTFRLHGFSWKISLSKNENFLAVFLEFLDSSTAVAWFLNTKFMIKLINQKDILKCHHHGLYIHPFGEDNPSAGYDNFMEITELFNESNGWVVSDSALIEVELQDLEVLESKPIPKSNT